MESMKDIEFIDGISESESDDDNNSSSSSGCCSSNESDNKSVESTESNQIESSTKNNKNKRKRKRRKRGGRTDSSKNNSNGDENSSSITENQPPCCGGQAKSCPKKTHSKVPHQSSTESSDFCVEFIKRQKSEVLTSSFDRDGEPILDPDGVPLKIRENTSDDVDKIKPNSNDGGLKNSMENILGGVNNTEPNCIAGVHSTGNDTVEYVQEIPISAENIVKVEAMKINNTVEDSSGRAPDADTSSSSDDECTLVESEKAQLQICGDSDFCRIDTRSNTYEGKTFIRHYVLKQEGTDIEGDIGLRPLDELLRVNGTRLKNTPQKQVKRIFRKIRLNRKTNQVKIQLRVRRWFRDPARGPLHEKKWKEVKEYELQLILVPTDEERNSNAEEIIRATANQTCNRKPYARSQSFRVANLNERVTFEERLNAGYIDIISLKGTQLCRYRSVMKDQFISSHIQDQGFVSTAVINETNTCEFRAEHFLGKDESRRSAFSNNFIFCIRLCIEQETGPIFLSSNIAKGKQDLKFVTEHADDFANLKHDHIIDERCFIIRAIGDIVLFQSLIYRDRFISVNKDTGRLYLLQISKTEQNAFVAGEEQPKARGEAYRNAARKFQTCKFEKFKVRQGLSHILHRTLDNIVGRFFCGLGGLGRTDTTV